MRKKLIFSFQNFKNCYWNGKDQSAVRDFSLPDILNRRKKIVPTLSPQGHTSSPDVVLSWSAKNPVSRWRSCFPRAPGFEVVRMHREPPGCKSPCVSIICIFNTKLLKLRPFYFFITFLGLFIGIFKNWYDTFDSRNWLHIIHGVIKDVFDGEICPQNSWLWYQ